MSDLPPTIVRRRRVFYIPGYDPHPPQRYRELYRAEAKKQAEISDYVISLREAADRKTGWQVIADIEGEKTRSAYQVLVWSDIVRATMDRSIAGTYRQLLTVARIYIFSGALRRLMWLRKGPILAGFYPVLMLLAQLILAVLLGLLAGALVTGGLGWLIDRGAALFGMGAVTGGTIWRLIDTLLTLAILVPVVRFTLIFAKRQDGRFFAYYLMHDLAYTVQARGAYPPELDQRIDHFAARIEAVMAENIDEILVVGHSSGAQLAVSALARVLRRRPDGAGAGPALSLLTLGQSIPMVSFLPDASDLRRDLHDLAGSEEITWLDISAPGDGCSFALCDPVAVSGVQPERPLWPLVVSAAYSRTLTPETLEALKHRYFRLHFQYLCAFDRPGDYDFFRITAGPRTLGDRFRGRKPSVSRIDVPASGYRTMAA